MKKFIFILTAIFLMASVFGATTTLYEHSVDYTGVSNNAIFNFNGGIAGGWTTLDSNKFSFNGASSNYDRGARFTITNTNLDVGDYLNITFNNYQTHDRWNHIGFYNSSNLGFAFERMTLSGIHEGIHIRDVSSSPYVGGWGLDDGDVKSSYVVGSKDTSPTSYNVLFNGTHTKVYRAGSMIINWTSIGKTLTDIERIDIFTQAYSSGIAEIQNLKIVKVTPGETPFINNDVKPYYNTSTININLNTTSEVNMTYSLDGGSELSICNNCDNYTLTLINLSEQEHEIILFSENEVSKINVTETFITDYTAPNISISTNLTTTLFLVNFSNALNVSDALSGVASCFINVTYLENVTNASQYDKFVNCTDVVSFEVAGTYNGVAIVTDNAGNVATASANGTISPLIYINFFDKVSVGITNYTYTIFHPDGRETSVENTDNPVELSPVNEGELDLGLHTIQFEKFGYETQNVSVFVNLTDGGLTYNFTILFAQILIKLYDDDTKALITNESFSLQLSGPAGYIFSSNGSLFNITSFVIGGTYTGLISSTNYESKEIFFTYTNQEIKTLDVYFIPLNLTNLGFVTIEAYNADNTPAQYVSTYAKQWFASESIFKKVQETKTGGDGTAELKIILEDYIYQFCIYTETSGETCTDDEIIKTTENGMIIPITEEKKILTQNSFAELLNFEEDIEVQVSNVTGFRNLYVQFDWVDLSGFNLEMCYNIYKDYQYTKELVDSNCVVGSAGTFEQIYLLNSSYAYIVDVTAFIDNTALPMYRNTFVSAEASESIEGVLEDKGMTQLGLVLYIIVVMTIVALLKNPFHGVVVVLVSVIGVNVFFSTLMGPFALSSLMAFCGMTAWGLRQLR